MDVAAADASAGYASARVMLVCFLGLDSLPNNKNTMQGYREIENRINGSTHG